MSCNMRCLCLAYSLLLIRDGRTIVRLAVEASVLRTFIGRWRQTQVERGLRQQNAHLIVLTLVHVIRCWEVHRRTPIDRSACMTSFHSAALCVLSPRAYGFGAEQS